MRLASLKCLLLYSARALGLFRLSRYLTRHKLRIVCYHGFSIGDEYLKLPLMFMRAETFQRRMAALQRMKLPVISLECAVERLISKDIANAETVITLDDGWASNLSIAQPILEKYDFPATVYVTTEHLPHGTEVFNVVLNYLFLETDQPSVQFIDIHPSIDGTYSIKPDPLPALEAITASAARFMSFTERQRSLRKIASGLGFDIDDVLTGSRFRLLTADEMAELSRRGVSIELHTHSHTLPTNDYEAVRVAIQENRDTIERITGKTASHFCYPSGKHHPSHLEWLPSLGIVSATTCDEGLNEASSNLLLLNRYLDQDDAADIDFEASLSGFRYLLRRSLQRSP